MIRDPKRKAQRGPILNLYPIRPPFKMFVTSPMFLFYFIWCFFFRRRGGGGGVRRQRTFLCKKMFWQISTTKNVKVNTNDWSLCRYTRNQLYLRVASEVSRCRIQGSRPDLWKRLLIIPRTNVFIVILQLKPETF